MPSFQQHKSLRKEYYCAYLQVNVYGDRCAIDMTDVPRYKYIWIAHGCTIYVGLAQARPKGEPERGSAQNGVIMEM